MPELLKRKTPIARKDHRCNGCGSLSIPMGFKYLRDTYAFDGRVYDWKLCDGCEDITPLVTDNAFDPDDGIGPEDYFTWADEARWSDDVNESRKAKAYLIRSGNSWILEDEDT